MTLERGSLLNKRYRIVDILGQGGMGAVYRAVDENLGIEVAVKENLFLTEEYARQFRREATILAGLRHTNLPRVGDHFGIDSQGQYLVMDYIDGEDLRQRMERIGSLTEEETILIGAAICDALAYLHTRKPPVVHRDIKPGNVKITPDGQIVLVDFGLAKLMHESQATTTGARAMTPGYSPPEQYGTARTDSRTDIYSLAATLYAALTGIIPEDGLARATGNAELTPLRKLNTKINRKFSQVIERVLAIHPEDLYQTAEEFKSALLDALISARRPKGEITVPPPPRPVEPAVEVFDPGNGSAPVPMALARPVSQPIYIPERPWRSGSNWLALALLILLLGSGAALILYPPDPNQTLIAFLVTSTTTPTPTQEVSGITLPVGAVSTDDCQGPGCNSPSVNRATQTATLPVPVTPTITFTPTDIPTPQPTPLGGGMGEIAFVSDRTGNHQIWIMDSNGGGSHQVTNLPGGACQPSWSPDGLRLVFISPCAGKSEIYERTSMYIIGRDGEDLQPLIASPEGDFDPAWSPDGDRIAFTSLRNGQPHVFVLNLVDNSVRMVSNLPFGDKNPAWSPSGTQLAFIRFRSSAEVWIISDTGQNEFKFSTSGNVHDVSPTWSPDGQVIYYGQTTLQKSIPWLMGMRYEDRGTVKEFRIPSTTQPDLGPIEDANVSPDGFWITYESWPEGDNHDIYRMTITGANIQRLTTDPGNDYNPVWNPAR